MASEKKVINIFMIILTFLFYCNSTSSETKKYTNLEILYEDPLVFETLEFTREFYKKSEYIENDKEICYFFHQIGNMSLIIYSSNIYSLQKII